VRRIIVAFALLVTTLGGCLAGDSEYDNLWEQGYGFNNPNAAKEKSGRLQ
jgi:hypothetical protein